MSNKPRTEEQKLRRKYLSLCKKKGIKPMNFDMWKKEVEVSKISTKTKPTVKKPAKKVDKPADNKPRKVFVEKGDIVIFRGYAPNQIMRLAMLMLVDVLKDISGHKH